MSPVNFTPKISHIPQIQKVMTGTALNYILNKFHLECEPYPIITALIGFSRANYLWPASLGDVSLWRIFICILNSNVWPVGTGLSALPSVSEQTQLRADTHTHTYWYWKIPTKAMSTHTPWIKTAHFMCFQTVGRCELLWAAGSVETLWHAPFHKNSIFHLCV